MEQQYGLLIDYQYCTGCHSCEVACQQEHSLPAEVFGIKVSEFVLKTRNGISIDYVPFRTELCNFCAHRTKDGLKPSCVKHCQSQCMYHGTLDELLEKMKECKKPVLYSSKK